MKFLVLWHFDLTQVGPEVAHAVMQMRDYAKKVGDKLECATTSSAVTVELGFTSFHRTKNWIKLDRPSPST
jgi:hypothetical protein